ncbi:MAG TPA: helix-turn-helix transcriptional regulator [Actinophytocola sp.]|uniref:helix-turn-helix domain-containing protein n=1 Tax=Actinophytocola sp. TaxID=1872138 RepID=UPI002DBBA352|nr:helix-turn-helix transcriptional regulator [Actinophytocola sp.]HEU5474103.1 helix-turn-helix transcriptional regulator [Actinophytocola sp.]
MSPPMVPAEFWLTPELCDAFAAAHIGRVVRAYRRHPHHTVRYGAGGISQTLLGQWLGLTQAQVSRIENGPPVKNLDTLAHWARVLRVPAELLWFDLPGCRRTSAAGAAPELALHGGEWLPRDSTELAELVCTGGELAISPETVTRLVHEWLVTEPPQLVEVRSGRRISDRLVSRVERRTAELRRMDDFVAGGDLHGLVERELNATAGLLREASYTEILGRRLLAALGELCQLAGWVVGDAGRYGAAARYYTTGVKAAHAAGSSALAANLISTLAYQVANVGNPRDAVLLAQSADSGPTRTTATARALFKERLAWTYARAGDRRATERTLAAAETGYEQRVPDDDPEWVYWLDEAELTVMAGRCHVELGLPERAVPLLAGALAHYDERHSRELALYTSWLAEAQLQLGAVDAAVAAATRTLELTSRITSARTDDRVNLLRRKLQPYRDVPAVADFEAMVRELNSSN